MIRLSAAAVATAREPYISFPFSSFTIYRVKQKFDSKVYVKPLLPQLHTPQHGEAQAALRREDFHTTLNQTFA